MGDSAPRVTRLTTVAIALTVAVMTGTAGYLVGRYPRLVPMLPVHFTRGGIPDRWVLKSWALVLMPVTIQIALALVFGTIGAIVLYRAAAARPAGGEAGTAEDPDHDRRMLATAEAIALLSFVWIAFQGLAAVQLASLWEAGAGGLGGIYAVGLLTAIALSIVVGVRSMRIVGHAPSAAAGDGPHWRLKVLYVNRADPRLFVPARIGIGYTLNFGRRAAVLFLAGVLVVGVGIPVAIVRYLIH